MYSDANRYILRIVLRPHREIAVAKTPYCSLFSLDFKFLHHGVCGMKRIILASTSTYRKGLMKSAGFDALCVAPEYDESSDTFADPYQTIEVRARNKARAVARDYDGDIVVGSDQGLVYDGALIGKPYTVEGADAQLMCFRVQTLCIATSLCVRCNGVEKCAQNVAKLVFRDDLNEETIRCYVAADMPIDCAGSFKIESRGSRLFSAIYCDDPTAIQGLPMMALNGFILAFERGYATAF